MQRLWICALALLLVGSTSCGGGAREQTVQRTFLFGPIAGFTGFMTQVATGGPTYVPVTNVPIRVGDDANNDQVKGYASFDISTLPEGAQITNAVIRMNQEAVEGVPYGVLGPGIAVDHVDLGFALELSDWDGNALGLNIGTLSSSPALGPVQVEVAQEIAIAVTLNRTTVSFRFAFPTTTNVDDTSDQAVFTKAGELLQPFLEVEATVPNR